MSNEKKRLFIDANLYLSLYKVTKGKLLLKPLQSLEQHLFVSDQIVQEVERCKLKVAADFFAMQFKKLELRNFEVPDHFFAFAPDLRPRLRSQLEEIQNKINEVNKDMREAAEEILGHISRSTDDVSKALHEIFKGAYTPSPKELVNAQNRKNVGNPPGKNQDPLGDQINWEQILSQCKQWSDLWITTTDSDYGISDPPKFLLNPFLRNELHKHNPNLKVHCFTELLPAIQDFTESVGADLRKQITPKDAEDIKKEQKSLIGFWAPLPPYLEELVQDSTFNGPTLSSLLSDEALRAFMTPRDPDLTGVMQASPETVKGKK